MGVRFEEVYQRQKNAVYGCLSYARKKQPVLLEEADMERLEAEPGPGPEERMLEEEKAKVIREVLSSLNADDRTIILLRDYEKMAYADIAGVMGLSETVVKVRLHRARMRYRKRYEQRGGGDCGV